MKHEMRMTAPTRQQKHGVRGVPAITHRVRAEQPNWRHNLWVLAPYLTIAAALFLPYVSSSLENVKWLLVISVASIGILKWYSERRVFSVFTGGLVVLLIIAVGIRAASVLWSPFPVYTALRGISLALMFLFLLVFVSRLAVSGQFGLVRYLILLLSAAWILPGVLLWLAGQSYVPLTGRPIFVGSRFAGILGGPNVIGICCSVCLPVIVSLFIFIQGLFTVT
ncbi:MAG: hypothetical protein IH987_03305 [Planctomycetes bacterium]|nr:hypothetical protein [Planctomycetota bacterium]